MSKNMFIAMFRMTTLALLLLALPPPLLATMTGAAAGSLQAHAAESTERDGSCHLYMRHEANKRLFHAMGDLTPKQQCTLCTSLSKFGGKRAECGYCPGQSRDPTPGKVCMHAHKRGKRWAEAVAAMLPGRDPRCSAALITSPEGCAAVEEDASDEALTERNGADGAKLKRIGADTDHGSWVIGAEERLSGLGARAQSRSRAPGLDPDGADRGVDGVSPGGGGGSFPDGASPDGAAETYPIVIPRAELRTGVPRVDLAAFLRGPSHLLSPFRREGSAGPAYEYPERAFEGEGVEGSDPTFSPPLTEAEGATREEIDDQRDHDRKETLAALAAAVETQPCFFDPAYETRYSAQGGPSFKDVDPAHAGTGPRRVHKWLNVGAVLAMRGSGVAVDETGAPAAARLDEREEALVEGLARWFRRDADERFQREYHRDRAWIGRDALDIDRGQHLTIARRLQLFAEQLTCRDPTARKADGSGAKIEFCKPWEPVTSPAELREWRNLECTWARASMPTCEGAPVGRRRDEARRAVAEPGFFRPGGRERHYEGAAAKEAARFHRFVAARTLEPPRWNERCCASRAAEESGWMKGDRWSVFYGGPGNFAPLSRRRLAPEHVGPSAADGGGRRGRASAGRDVAGLLCQEGRPTAPPPPCAETEGMVAAEPPGCTCGRGSGRAVCEPNGSAADPEAIWFTRVPVRGEACTVSEGGRGQCAAPTTRDRGHEGGPTAVGTGAVVRGRPSVGGGGGEEEPVSRDELDEAYRVLGVPSGADESAVKKAFRGLAIRNHPDKGGTVETIQKITNANDAIRIARGW